MEGPVECCGKDNLYFSKTKEQIKGKMLRETWLQCRVCGALHDVPRAGFPTFEQLSVAIKHLVDSDKTEFLRLKSMFFIYDEKTPEQKFQGYFNMWIWLRYGPTWAAGI
jgi:hypothetical protein